MSDRPPGNPLQRLPMPALFFVVAGLWVVLQLVFSSRPITSTSVIAHVVAGLLFSAVVTAGIAFRRRRLGGAEEAITYLRALRTGVVPPGTDTSRWREELDHTERLTARQRWTIRIGALLPFGLGIWGTTDPDARVLGIVLAILAVAAVVAGEIGVRRQRRRIDELRASITG